MLITDNPKKLIEVLGIVRQRMKSDHFNTRGICYYIATIWCHTNLSFSDGELIEKWFKKLKPTARKYREFYKGAGFTNGAWWWTKNQEGKEQRIKFLDMLIAELQEKL